MNTHSKVTRYALVGAGARSFMFSDALLDIYKRTSSLVALCDVNQQRMDFHNQVYARKYGAEPVPTWLAKDFDHMIAQQKPQVVIVATIDRLHHDYIIRSMEHCCDVITEKPMTTDLPKCRAILETVERTGRVAGDFQLPLFALALESEGIALAKRCRRSQIGPLRMATRYLAWSGLLSPLASRQTQFRRADGSQRQAPRFLECT
jgi:hypothetical protein